jgi:hypothetical protein
MCHDVATVAKRSQAGESASDQGQHDDDHDCDSTVSLERGKSSLEPC